MLEEIKIEEQKNVEVVLHAIRRKNYNYRAMSNNVKFDQILFDCNICNTYIMYIQTYKLQEFSPEASVMLPDELY